ncbi:hypothetical protein N665_0765s0009 [Sinapis alba]|nr:hypothetical protein N665_0765s0009 [Sinapis alba]KAF8083567.1 hypothetical protein N665_0765s0009 [Sinapis alba]
MGAQMILCDGFEVVPPPLEMNDLILFGSDQSGGGDSNCGESTVTTEEDGTVFSGDSSPGWRETKLFSFYFVKQPVYDDPDIKSKINEADSVIYHCNKRRIDISTAQKSQRAELSSLYAQMESLVAKSQGCEVVSEEKELEAIRWNIQQLSDKVGQIQNKIMVLDAEMAYILEHRDKSYERIKMLRIQRDKGNAEFFQSIAVMRKAKELAASGNVRDLEVYSSSEVDRFMTRWNSDKAYRDDYVKRISHSLCERQMSRDGRIKDHEGEKQPPVKTRKEGMAVHKMNKEDSSSNSSQDGDVITDKERKEVGKKAMEFNGSSAEESDVIDLEFPAYENPKKEDEEVDEERLKERKREEQLEKARSAMERKRKLQEKNATKTAIRAQKEAEKKLKECEKKAKKKKAAANSSPLLQSQEAINELEKVSTIAVSGKEKQRSMFPKQRSFRYKHRGRGTEALPKAILNRRKAHRYWVWGLSSAALALALFLAFLLLR